MVRLEIESGEIVLVLTLTPILKDLERRGLMWSSVTSRQAIAISNPLIDFTSSTISRHLHENNAYEKLIVIFTVISCLSAIINLFGVFLDIQTHHHSMQS